MKKFKYEIEIKAENLEKAEILAREISTQLKFKHEIKPSELIFTRTETSISIDFGSHSERIYKLYGRNPEE